MTLLTTEELREIYDRYFPQGVLNAPAAFREVEAAVLAKLQAQSEPVLTDAEKERAALFTEAVKRGESGFAAAMASRKAAPVQQEPKMPPFFTQLEWLGGDVRVHVFQRHEDKLPSNVCSETHPVQQEPAHTDHPARHYDRTCAACQDDEYRCGGPDCDGNCCQPVQQEPVACKKLCELCEKRGYISCANAAKITTLPPFPVQQDIEGHPV